MLVEVAGDDFAGAIVKATLAEVTVRNRRGAQRVFRNEPGGFWVDDVKVSLVPVARAQGERAAAAGVGTPAGITRSGSIATPKAKARVARASRIWVEGVHDAELLEHVWGEDLRYVGVVVEPIGGINDLKERIADFAPSPTRRLGVLVDHLVSGSKEERICRPWLRGQNPDVLVTGHPEIDIWAAVLPERVGLERWPQIPMDIEWKRGICDALGVDEPWQFWKGLLAKVRTVKDLDRTLWRAVEELIDHVTIEDTLGGEA
ncbi:MAG: hypothetical protein ACI867_001485 [Glaciecola sp.]|jgi:hypothetical protein